MSFATLKQRTIEYLIQRKSAYWFGLPVLLRGLKPDEVPGPPLEMMISDLARFCRATSDVTGTTDRETYILIGRRQVFLRIMEHLYLPPEQLYELYSKFRPPQEDEQ